MEMKLRIPLRCCLDVDEVHRVGRAAERRWAWSFGKFRSSILCSGHAHFGTMPRYNCCLNVSAACPFLPQTGHAAEHLPHVC